MPIRASSNTSPARRPAARPSDGRERLLRVGMELFGTMPYDAVSMTEVAAAADVAVGLPFHHFGSKRGFYVAVVRELVVEMRMIHGSRAGLAPADSLRDMLRRHITWMKDHPYTMVAVGIGPAADPQVKEIVDQARHEGAADVLSLLGVSRPAPALRLAVRGWVGMVDHTIEDWLANGRDLPLARVIELLVAALVGTLDAATSADPQITADASAFTQL